MSNLAHLQSLMPVLPELVLAGGAMLLLMVGAFSAQIGRSAAVVNAWCVALLGAVAWILMMYVPAGRIELFGGSFVVDDYARFLKVLAVIGSAGSLLLSFNYLDDIKQQKFEYGVLFLLSTLGMLMLISANDLIAL